VDVPRLGEPHFALDVAGMVRAIRQHQARVVFLASPNNPTGGLVTEQELLPLLAEQCVVVLDEVCFLSDLSMFFLTMQVVLKLSLFFFSGLR
jgi:histidinol-phosphate aminotransferase